MRMHAHLKMLLSGKDLLRYYFLSFFLERKKYCTKKFYLKTYLPLFSILRIQTFPFQTPISFHFSLKCIRNNISYTLKPIYYLAKFLVFAIFFLVTSSLKLPIQYSIVDCRKIVMLARYIETDFTFFFLFSTDHAHKGNLYTLFLHSPMSAFCFVTNVVDIPIHLWDKCLAYIDRFMTEASRLITRCRGVGKSIYSMSRSTLDELFT